MLKGCYDMSRENAVEKRIIFEMTGRRIQSSDFPKDEETDEEYDMLLKLRDARGYDEEAMPEEDN